MESSYFRLSLLQLLTVIMVTAMAVPLFAAGESLLHNSQNTGSAKWNGDGGWGVQNGKYGEFSCTTCHNKTTDNIKRVVDSIPATIGPNVSKPVTFNNMTGFGDESVARASSVGICNVCHTITTSHRYDNTGQAVRTHSNGNCTECHSHTNGFKAPATHAVPLYATTDGHPGCASSIGCHVNSDPGAAYPTAGSAPDCRACHTKADPTVATNGCGSCHGAANGTGEPTGTVHPDAAGSHSVHTALTACVNCHDTGGTGGNANHGKGNRGTNPAVVNVATSMAWSGASCANAGNASCHADPYSAGAVATPNWGTTGNGCAACHTGANVITANGPATGSHSGHTGIACISCHAAGTTTTTTGDGHRDGNIDIVNVGYQADVAKHAAGSGYSTCSNFYCHSKGTTAVSPFTVKTTPVWNGTVNCVSCHGGGRGGAQFSSISTGRHLKHINSTYAYNYSCETCHATTVSGNTTISNAGNHVNKEINVAFSGAAITGGASASYATNGHAPGAVGTVDQSCNNIYCHSNAQIGGQVGTNYYFRNLTGAKRFNQTTTVSLGCNGCHSTGSTTTGKWTLSGAHLAHLSLTVNPQIGKVLACNDCHANGGTNLNRANHANALINYSGALSGSIARGNLKLSTGRCNTVYCHSNGQGLFNNMSTNNWFSGAPLNCNGCHGDAATATNLSGKHDSHINYAATGGNFGCVDCHASTASSNTALTATGKHVNAFKDFSGAKVSKTGFIPGSGNCTTYCHSDGKNGAPATAVTWTGSAIDCKGCHGGGTSQAGEPVYASGNSHPQHVGTTSADATCQNCHSGTMSGSVLGGADHLNKAINVAQGNGKTFTFNAGTCSNISCHGGAGTTANWGATLNCKGCHATLSAGHTPHISTLLDERADTLVYDRYSANASSGTVYKFGCANCHPVAVANHLNGTVDVDLITTAGSGALKAKNGAASMNGSKQCLNVYCHSNGYSATTVYATTLAWGSTNTGDKCAACHGNSPSASGQIAGSNAHAAHVVGIHDTNIFSGSIGKLPRSAATGGAINAAHGTNSRSTTINCNICHNDTVITSANDKNSACISCHNGTDAPLKNSGSLISNTAFHVNGQVNVKFADTKIVSKAQVSESAFNSYTAASEGGWTRNNGLYKNFTSAYDVTRTTLFSTAAFSAGDCSNVACHAGKPVKWTDTISCNNCHSRL